MSHELRKPVRCPWCKTRLDAATDPFGDSAKPEAGDATLCIKCGKFSLFLGASELRKPTHDEMQELMRSPEVMALWIIWRSVNEDNPRR